MFCEPTAHDARKPTHGFQARSDLASDLASELASELASDLASELASELARELGHSKQWAHAATSESHL